MLWYVQLITKKYLEQTRMYFDPVSTPQIISFYMLQNCNCKNKKIKTELVHNNSKWKKPFYVHSQSLVEEKNWQDIFKEKSFYPSYYTLMVNTIVTM